MISSNSKRVFRVEFTMSKFGFVSLLLIALYLLILLVFCNRLLRPTYITWSHSVTYTVSNVFVDPRDVRQLGWAERVKRYNRHRPTFELSEKEYSKEFATNRQSSDIEYLPESVLKSDIGIEEKKNTRKYLFALRHYEQLGKATKNLLSLASLATETDRHAVMPFVNSSRVSGIPSGFSVSRLRAKLQRRTSSDKFSNMSRYFDVGDFQNILATHNYNRLTTFDEFRRDCRRIDVVVHFLHNDAPHAENEYVRLYRRPRHEYDTTLQKTRQNGGWMPCEFLRQSRISDFLDVPVDRYVCVDSESIRTGKELEEKVLQASNCAAIVSWKGVGPKRNHFPTADGVTELKPSMMKHNRRLIGIARDFVTNQSEPFATIHVRSERHLVRKGLAAFKTCVDQLNSKLRERLAKLNVTKTFVASDMVKGSDTLDKNTNSTDSALAYLNDQLPAAFTFRPHEYGLYDRGEIAIVEMHILSMGESLFTLGSGSFQEWVEDLFLASKANDRTLIFKTCDLKSLNR